MTTFTEEIAKVMANKAALVNIAKRDGSYEENIREFPFYSELKGIEQTLNIMGVKYEYDFDETVQFITGVHIGDVYAEV